MPSLIRTQSAMIKTTRKETTTTKISKTKNFTAKTQHLKLKAPSNNVRLLSDETLTTQIYFFLTTQQIRVFLNETRIHGDKKNK